MSAEEREAEGSFLAELLTEQRDRWDERHGPATPGAGDASEVEAIDWSQACPPDRRCKNRLLCPAPCLRPTDIELLVESLTRDEPKPLDPQLREGVEDIARMVLASDWLAAREAAARAEELTAAADDLPGHFPVGEGARAWLRRRAARIARGDS